MTLFLSGEKLFFFSSCKPRWRTWAARRPHLVFPIVSVSRILLAWLRAEKKSAALPRPYAGSTSSCDSIFVFILTSDAVCLWVYYTVHSAQDPNSYTQICSCILTGFLQTHIQRCQLRTWFYFELVTHSFIVFCIYMEGWYQNQLSALIILDSFF